MRLIKLSAISICALLGTTSCSLFRSNTPTETPLTPAQVANIALTATSIPEILYGNWYITRADSIDISADSNGMPTVTFAAEAGMPVNVVRYYAYDGCNNLSGLYATNSNGKISLVGEPISTLKMCDDVPYELSVATGLITATSFKVEKVGESYELYLLGTSGTPLLTLRKNNIDFINGAWKVELINGTSVPESADIKLVLDTQTKTVHGETGCNILNGKIKIESNSDTALSFSDMATTRMMCPDIETEQKLLEALNKVVAVRPGLTSESAALLNAEGDEVVSMSRLTIKH